MDPFSTLPSQHCQQDTRQNKKKRLRWEGCLGDQRRAVDQGVYANGQEQVSREQVDGRKEQSPGEEQGKVQRDIGQRIAVKNPVGDVGQDEDPQHRQDRPGQPAALVRLPELEIELAQKEAAVEHFLVEGISQQLANQRTDDGCYAALAPQRIEMDVAVDGVDQQDDRLGRQPEHCSEGQSL